MHPQIDRYTVQVLKSQLNIHKDYVLTRMRTSKELNIKFRLPAVPEDISENIVKFIIHKTGDTSTKWGTTSGDLYSSVYGRQECKSFTSNGPLSFTPTSDWDVIYFLDMRRWLEDKYVLYSANIKRSSPEWMAIKINRNQTFADQSIPGRRPRISWESLYPQISKHCVKIYEGPIDHLTDESSVEQSIEPPVETPHSPRACKAKNRTYSASDNPAEIPAN